MASPYSLFAISFCVSLTLLNPLSCHAQYLFVFGDSLWDPGNNQYINPTEYLPAYHPPYGMTFFNHSTGRNSDGRVVPDFIASYMNLPFMPPALAPDADFSHGASFASAGGAVFDANTASDAMSFLTQISHFSSVAASWSNDLGEEEALERLNNAVYMISMGGNDYFSYIHSETAQNASVPQLQAYVDTVITNMTSLIEDIYNAGGRKFMVQTVAPIGCLPMMKKEFEIDDEGCAGKPLTIARLHNANLTTVLKDLQNKLAGFTYSIFDYHTAIGKRINNPTKYGFKVGDVGCCGAGSHRGGNCGDADVEFQLCFDPSEFVFFDGGHNTEAANHQMADLMWDGPSTVVAPYTFKQLYELQIPTTKTSSRKSARFHNNYIKYKF